MAYETLIVEIEDYIALIRLNRPEALNALNAKMLTELATVLHAADANDKVRCIIITGSEKAFAAGADIKEMAGQSFVDAYSRQSVWRYFRCDPRDSQTHHRRSLRLCLGRRL